MSLPLLDYSRGWLSSLAATRLAFGLSSGFGQAKETERAADAGSSGGAVFSTGGGFSERYDMPPWQREAVNGYLASQAGVDALPGFNRAGRAYPDISMVGNKLLVVLDGQLYSVSGTSAATPIVAAIAARVNLVRESNGLPQLGSLNPTLYTHHHKSPSMSFADITEGANHCPAPGSCHCAEGFAAAEGWDPVSGLGAVDAQALYEIAAYQASPPPPSFPPSSPPSPSAPSPSPSLPSAPPPKVPPSYLPLSPPISPLIFSVLDFTKYMSITALVVLSGVEQVSGALTAYVGTEVRGVQDEPLTPPFGPYAGKQVFQITIGANRNGETLSFRFATAVVTTSLAETVVFSIEGNIGDPLAPFMLTGAGGSRNPWLLGGGDSSAPVPPQPPSVPPPIVLPPPSP